MELIERDTFLNLLQQQFNNTGEGEGHCVFVSGEAGIGKTSLVKAFCNEHDSDCNIYLGACDALFTPRPLAPLYDIIWQVNRDLWPAGQNIEERSELFGRFYRELSNRKEKSIIVFEDIHWADEATLDFIKFFARRIAHLQCLFILTFRDDEIHARHPIRTVLGQLSPDSFTRMQLMPLSRQAVEKMSLEKGYDGENVYTISGGNPFYVNEILASYSPGIPDNIKDSILSVYNRQDEKTRTAWDLLSILPEGFNIKYLETIDPLYSGAIQNSLESKIIILKDETLFFKHEIYRRTIEASLSPFTRVRYNKKMLDVFRKSFEQNQDFEKIVHHAKNANEYELVVQYAPLAAERAACIGSHIEASKLYLTAIEYYQGNDKKILTQFYESYAYECYLTNQIKEAIIYTGKSLNLWKEKNNDEKIGNCLRFLSRLWWFDGNGKKARAYGSEAVEILKGQSSSKAKAMAFSNMAQLKMLSDEYDECLLWGERSIVIAKELNDDEIISQALTSMGSALMLRELSIDKGMPLLQQSMEIALKKSYHEGVARAYIEMGSNGIIIKDYPFAKKILEEGINYCDRKDLDSMKLYMLGWLARLNLETGFWDEAYGNAIKLIENEDLLPVIKISALTIAALIKMRKGGEGALSLLLEAKDMAFETMELQRIVLVSFALLEYEWITGEAILETGTINKVIDMMEEVGKISKQSKFYYWLSKARKQFPQLGQIYLTDTESNQLPPLQEAAKWKKIGCPYEHALALFEGSEDDKRRTLAVLQELGAEAVCKKLKLEMRMLGIKSIPRGIRKSTLANSALLTNRELDILLLLKEELQNKEIAARLFISPKTVDHHISSILFKLNVNSRIKAVNEAAKLEII